MSWVERVTEIFGEYDEGFGPLTVDVPADAWVESVERARDALECTFFDWLSAVDELADGFSVVCHLARIGDRVEHLIVRTRVPREQPRLPTITHLFAGAGWHERETAEMFGIAFTGGPAEDPESAHLLLPEQFEGHPLRKEFVLASRVVKPWPGAKEPGESDEAHAASPSRRRTRPPGVPDPEQWGPREPGSPAPDPLAHAAPGPPARPRRARRQTPGSGTPEDADG